MTSSPSSGTDSSFSGSGDSFSSWPRWRRFLGGLVTTARHLGATLNLRRDPGYEQRMKQLESEIEQLKLENAREKALSASIRELCFSPKSSAIPLPATEPDCRPSSP